MMVAKAFICIIFVKCLNISELLFFKVICAGNDFNMLFLEGNMKIQI